MKEIFFIFLLLLPAKTLLACKCDKPPIYSRYMISDFIGIVKIENTKNVSATKRQRYYIASLEHSKTFKGKMPTNIRVAGTKLQSNSGGCEITIKPGEKWLIYLQRNNNGTYYVSYCSHPVKIENNNKETISISKETIFDLQQLQFLKNHVPNLQTNQLISFNYYKLEKFLKKFPNQSLKQPAAYFLVKFDKKLNPVDIQVLSGFSTGVNQQIVNYLRAQAHWYVGPFRPNPSNSLTLKKSTKYVIGIYYSDHVKSLLPFYFQ